MADEPQEPAVVFVAPAPAAAEASKATGDEVRRAFAKLLNCSAAGRVGDLDHNTVLVLAAVAANGLGGDGKQQ
jgi:hypothetical protein